MSEQIKAGVLILGFTVLSGIADTYGFTHASRIWDGGRLLWAEAARSAAGFCAGFVAYWGAVRYLRAVGVHATEAQTLLWFVVTILGVALLSGKIFQWERIDQAVAVGLLVGLGWLLVRTGG